MMNGSDCDALSAGRLAGPSHIHRAPGVLAYGGCSAACFDAGVKTQETLPETVAEAFDGHRIREIIQRVCRHYSVPVAFIALERPDCLRLKACRGVSAQYVPLKSVARHWVSRNLPIIIEDVDDMGETWSEDILVNGPVKMRFVTVAPLMSSASTCVGSLVIMDEQPRCNFNLKDSDFLTQSAEAVMALFKMAAATEDWWRLPVPSTAELPDMQERLEDSDDEE